MSLLHRVTHRHITLTKDQSVIEICSVRLTRKSYTVWMLRGPGYLWEKVILPDDTDGLNEWAAEQNL